MSELEKVVMTVSVGFISVGLFLGFTQHVGWLVSLGFLGWMFWITFKEVE